MNNSFPRLIDGMCATLRTEVLSRLDDEFARGQVFGVINLLNTFKVRADWSAGFLLQQIAAQHAALDSVLALVKGQPSLRAPVSVFAKDDPFSTPINELLAMRDQGNRSISEWLEWLDSEKGLDACVADAAIGLLREAMRAEVQIELKNAPRPLFAEMSSGSEN